MADQQQPVSFAQKHHFVIRRLHSLLGIVPVGVFVCVHFLANSTVLASADDFQTSVDRIHALEPFLTFVEIAFIFIPLAFHALLGLLIVWTGASNASDYRFGANIRYTLQRVTGVIAFVFILYHVWQMHWLGSYFGGGRFEARDASGMAMAAVTTASAIQSVWWAAPAYAIGILATAFHLANGVWTSLITWGITIRPSSQRGAGYVCTALGFALAFVGMGALYGFKNFDVKAARAHTAEAVAMHSH